MSEAKTKPKRTRVRRKTEVKILEVPPTAEGWLDFKQITGLLQISRSTFKMWVADGLYPPADYMIGDRGRWLVTTHNRWITSRPKPSTPPPRPFQEN